MGNCAGCTGPQRTYRVQRLEQNSPIKNRLSHQGTKLYPQSNSNIKELTFNQKDKAFERGSFNQNDIFGGIIGLSQSKSRPNAAFHDTYNSNVQPNQIYASNNNALYTPNNNYNTSTPQHYGDFTKDLLSQVVKTHIKLYPDNPQNLRQISPKLDKSYLYQRQEDLRNSKLDPSRKLSSPESYSKQLLKSVQSQSKRYLRDAGSEEKSSQKNNQINFNRHEQKSNEMIRSSAFQHSHMEHFLQKFDDISEIRTQKNSRINYQQQNSLPLKKYSKFNRGLTVIEEILQQDHKTPQDIKLQRKNNGEDVIFDAFQGFPEQLEPLEIPNLSEYLSILKVVVQKS